MLLLFSDWDETISAADTLSLIAPPAGHNDDGTTVSFALLGEAYMRDLSAHASARSDGGKPASLDEQLAYLESLDAVELQSQRRVEESRLFHGWDPAAAEERARTQVEYRKGWNDATAWLCSSAVTGGVQWRIISVGWSARFIRAALSSPAGGRSYLPPGAIAANEVELDPATGKGTGRLNKPGEQGIRVAAHKRRELERLLAEFRSDSEQAHGEESADIIVYAGDSTTDLECLLRANVGLLFGEAKSLLSTLDRIGLSECVRTPDAWHAEGRPVSRSGADLHARDKVLVHVRDWVSALPILQELCGPVKECEPVEE